MDGSTDQFSDEEQGFLEIAAEQLSELLYGRADVFVNAGLASASEGKGGGKVAVVNSSDIATPFQVELVSLNFCFDEFVDPSVKFFEIIVSLHVSVSQLCHPRAVIVEVPTADNKSGMGRRKSIVRNSGEMALNMRNRLIFNVATRDLPRAARILFRVSGGKKKKGPFIPIGWAAAPIFDFKGCMDTQVTVNLFEGDNEVPINTTLSNSRNDRAPSLSAVSCADLVMANSSASSHVTVVHSMPPSRSSPIQARVENFTDSDMTELDRILLLSFNPLSTNLLTAEDKDFLWDIRYNILERPELLAAFLMCVHWENAEHVQEVSRRQPELIELCMIQRCVCAGVRVA